MGERFLARRVGQDLGLKPVMENAGHDLGLTVDQIQATSKTLAALLRLEGPLTPPVVGELVPDLQIQLGYAMQREEASRRNLQTRRQFLSSIRNWSVGVGLIALTGTGTWSIFDYFWGPKAQSRQLEADRELENTYTLRETPSVSSFSGWTVRYAGREDGNFIPTNTVSNPLERASHLQLPSNRLGVLEDTGILLYEHRRSSDRQLVGKLSVITRYIPASGDRSGSYTVGQQWVLRDQDTNNPNILVLENRPNSLKYYLVLDWTKQHQSENLIFQLRVYQPQPRQ